MTDQTAADSLRAVEQAIEGTRRQSQPEPAAHAESVQGYQEPPRQSGDNIADYAALGAQAIQKYSEAAARHIEEAGDDILREAQGQRDECYQLAEDIRHAARVQAAAIEAHTARAKRAALSITETRKAYRDDLTREKTEMENAKQRAAQG